MFSGCVVYQSQSFPLTSLFPLGALWIWTLVFQMFNLRQTTFIQPQNISLNKKINSLGELEVYHSMWLNFIYHHPFDIKLKST